MERRRPACRFTRLAGNRFPTPKPQSALECASPLALSKALPHPSFPDAPEGSAGTPLRIVKHWMRSIPLSPPHTPSLPSPSNHETRQVPLLGLKLWVGLPLRLRQLCWCLAFRRLNDLPDLLQIA